MDCKLDLKTIALLARNSEYNPKVQKRRLLLDHEAFLLSAFVFFMIALLCAL